MENASEKYVTQCNKIAKNYKKKAREPTEVGPLAFISVSQD